MTEYPYKKRKLGHIPKEGKLCKNTERRQRCKAKEKGLEQVPPSEPAEGTNTANTLFLDF